MLLFCEGNPVSRTHTQLKGIKPLPSKTQVIKNMYLPKIPKQVCAFLWLMGYYRKYIRNFAKIAKPLTLLTCQQAKFKCTPTHHNAFLKLKESVIQAPILHYPNPKKCYIVYTDASDDTCGAQLSQEHDGTEFPIAFHSHMFTDTQWKWSTTEQEAYSLYYTVTKWNNFQGAEKIVHNDHKPLTRFSHIQYNFWVDIWSPQQSSWLPFMSSRITSRQTCNNQHAICNQP